VVTQSRDNKQQQSNYLKTGAVEYRTIRPRSEIEQRIENILRGWHEETWDTKSVIKYEFHAKVEVLLWSLGYGRKKASQLARARLDAKDYKLSKVVK